MERSASFSLSSISYSSDSSLAKSGSKESTPSLLSRIWEKQMSDTPVSKSSPLAGRISPSPSPRQSIGQIEEYGESNTKQATAKFGTKMLIDHSDKGKGEMMTLDDAEHQMTRNKLLKETSMPELGERGLEEVAKPPAVSSSSQLKHEAIEQRIFSNPAFALLTNQNRPTDLPLSIEEVDINAYLETLHKGINPNSNLQSPNITPQDIDQLKTDVKAYIRAFKKENKNVYSNESNNQVAVLCSILNKSREYEGQFKKPVGEITKFLGSQSVKYSKNSRAEAKKQERAAKVEGFKSSLKTKVKNLGIIAKTISSKLSTKNGNPQNEKNSRNSISDSQ